MAVKLGDLLLKENMVTPQQLQEALIVEKLSGVSLRRALVNLGFVRDEDITGLLSRRYGRSSVDLGNLEIDPAVIRVVPAETARKYQVLPLSRVDKTLRLAMADPSNVLAMDDISFMTGFKVEPHRLREKQHSLRGSRRPQHIRPEPHCHGGSAQIHPAARHQPGLHSRESGPDGHGGHQRLPGPGPRRRVPGRNE